MVNASHRPVPSFTRPPTPPKDNIEDSAKLPVGNTFQGTLGQQILLNTPEESPSSSSEYFNGPGGKLPKRVVFSPWTSYHKPLLSGGRTAILEEQLRTLPPSKECTASRKSILKISTNSSSPLSALPQQLIFDPNETVAAMLRSVNQHLNSASRDSRLDSYRTLLGCLSADEDVPDSQSLIENLTGFLEYIRRDISAKQPGSGNADLELASSALKVLGTVLYTPGLTNSVPHEFAVFIADQAVSSIENHDTPKIMLDHYMQLLARQKMSPKVINSEKANRILTALHGLEARVKGNRVIALKLMIYQRLLVQAKNSMVPRAEEWLEFLISAMSSSVKDIRSRAIACGTDAALALGATTAVSQSCIDILDRDTPAGPKVVDGLGTRLLQLLNVKTEALHVPQVWSVIVLFLRSRRRQIERWEHFKAWLGIMERAFNSSESKVRLHANIAWNRLISVINLDTATGASFIKVLRQPIASQLERKNSDSHVKHATSLARSSYCNLLYYSFCPGATHEQLDLYWDAFVAPILSVRSSMTKSDLDFSCDVLSALLSSSQPKVWDQNRAHQLSPMKPGELPCLDPKWIRFRGAKVINLLEDLLLHINLAPSDDLQRAPLFNTWQSFTKAIGDAASKEVKVSMETMTATAHILSSLSRYWNQTYNTAEAVSRRLELFIGLTNEAVTKIGFRPFSEKRILRSSGDCFEATETPTSRTGRPRGCLKSPIACILDTIVNTLHLSEPPSTYPEAIKTLLSIALRGATGRRARLALLRDLAITLSKERSVNVACRLMFWESIATETARALSLPQAMLQVNGSPQYLGDDYREAVRLLELAIGEIPTGTYPGWKALSEAVIDRVQAESCQEAILLVFTEPLSEVMHGHGPENTSDNFLRCGTYLLSHTPWPESRQALERARKLLWGPWSVPRGSIPLDPFDHLYSLLDMLLIATYSQLQSFSFDAIAAFLSGIKAFLLGCPISLRAVCLKRMQRGLAVWIEDGNAILPVDTTQGLGVLTISIRDLWEILTGAINSIPKPDSSFLADIQDLVLAGFRSRNRATVNDTITMWNQSFANAESLECPAKFQAELLKLRSRVDIGLPGFVHYAETEVMSSPFNFVESQEAQTEQRTGFVSSKDTPSSGQEPAHRDLIHTQKQCLLDKTHLSLAKPSCRGSRYTPKGRLRHDNSQIRFAAIDSSPLMAAVNESQHLTEHQEEVKERQEQGAAAMFPNIRSSPKLSRSAERPPELILHKQQALVWPLDADANPSPTFLPGDTIMNDFLGSSPTPHAIHKSPARHRPSQDPAFTPQGSPQFMPVHCNASEPEATTKVRDSEDVKKASTHASTTPNTPDESSKGSDPSSECQDDQGSAPVVTALEQRTTEGVVPSISDPEVFVDALVHPILDEERGTTLRNDTARIISPEAGQSTDTALGKPITPRRKSNHKSEATFIGPDIGGETTDVADSVRQAPVTPTEDELAREQLLRDLEEASSQANSQVSRRRPSLSSPSEASRRRKAHQIRGTKPRKTAKSPKPVLSCEVVVEKRKPDRDDDDCIIVDDRPAAGERMSATPIIKQEESPFQTRDPRPFSTKTLAPSVNPARRQTRSMASCGSQPSIIDYPSAPRTRSSRVRTRPGTRETDTTEQHPRKRRRTEEYQRAGHAAEDDLDDAGSFKQVTAREDKADIAAHLPSVGDKTPPTMAEDEITSSQMEDIKELLTSTHDPAPEAQGAGGSRPSSHSSDGDTVLYTPHDEPEQPEQAGAIQETARSPGQRMIDRFMHLLRDIRQVTFWPEEERKMVEVAFEVVKNVHESGRRNGWQQR
ncbi:MAG: hypothetical protein Q9216_001873 [Gyalolechia sp. 2 TL-2023]